MKNYDEYIDKVAEYAKQNPSGYRLRLALLTLLGYAFILLVLGGLLLGLGIVLLFILLKHLICIKFLFVLIIAIFLILKSFWVKLSPPDGIKVDIAKLSPLLDKELHELRKALNTPPIHEILFDHRYNLSICQVPRLGILGFPKNYLTIGLPMMQCLSPQEFRGVLAHELAHISRAHGMKGSRVYCLRRTWSQLLENLCMQDDWISAIFNKFFKWYIPFFSAYSFVDARHHEYEADKYAAEVVGEKVVGYALIKTGVIASFLQESFWPDFNKRVIHSDVVPEMAITEMLNVIECGIPEEKTRMYMASDLLRKTNNFDVHPGLSDRLANINCTPDLPANCEITATEHFLGENLKVITDVLNKIWRRDYEIVWQEKYKYFNELKEELKVLDEKEDLTRDDIWQYATIYEQIHGHKNALAIYEKILELTPGDPSANYAVGSILLLENKRTGVFLVKKAMEMDKVYSRHCCMSLYEYYLKNHSEQEADYYYKKYIEHLELFYAAREERQQLALRDEMEFHDMPLDQLMKYPEVFKKYPEIEKVYLTRKKVEYLPEEPFYIMSFVIKWPWKLFASGYDNDIRSQNIINEAFSEIELPRDFKGSFYLILLNHSSSENLPFEKKMKMLSNSLLYVKGKDIDFSYCYSMQENNSDSSITEEVDIDHYRFEKMLTLQIALLEEKEGNLGEDHPEVAAIYDEIAKTYRDKGDIYHAIINYEKALSIFKKQGEKSTPAIATTYNNLAAVYVRMQDYDYAIKLYQDSMDLFKKSTGESNQFLAVIYNNIGEVYKKKEDYNKAIDFYNKSYEIKNVIFGKNHASTLATFENIKKLNRLKELNKF